MPNFIFARFAVSLTHGKRTQLGFLHLNYSPFLVFNSFTSATLSEISESNERKQRLEQENDLSTASYLMSSCGLSPKLANEISKRVHLKNPGRADSVLNLLRSFGFSETQISIVVTRHPSVLLVKPENTLLSKLTFLQSIGFLGTDLPKLLARNPRIIRNSLKNFIIPSYEVLRTTLMDDDKVLKTIKRARFSFFHSPVMEGFVPNVKLLRELGVPESSISCFVTRCPDVAFLNHTKFVECVKSAKDIGIDLSKPMFMVAIQAMAYLKKSTWESKLRIYERMGWTREVTMSTFKKYPYCMLLSVEKIQKSMTFLVDEMGWSLDNIVRNPAVLSCSLKKRIIPRCSVYKILKMKGLVKSDQSISSLIFPCEKFFLERFVVRFQKNVPQLLEVYKRQIDPLHAKNG